MSIKKYLLVIQLSIQDAIEYKFDFFVHTLKYAVMVLLMTLLWSAVEKANPTPLLTQNEIVMYFFFSALLYSLSNFHTWYIEQDIKQGTLSKFLIKPVSTTGYYLSFQSASVFIETVLKTVVFLPLLYLLGFSFDTFTLQNILLFLLYLPLIYVSSFFLLSGISLLTFWIIEAYALRWALTITFRFLSGILVPLAFFPTFFQNISFYFPFQHLAYTPIQLILGKVSVSYALQGLLVLFCWLIVFISLHQWIWKKGISGYESTGI